MSESSPVEGSRSPDDKSTRKKGAEPDPDKFKELLKADESDQTKKQKKQQEQELEDELNEELEEEIIDQKASLFDSYMKSGLSDSESLFAAKDSDSDKIKTKQTDSKRQVYDQIYSPSRSRLDAKKKGEPTRAISSQKQDPIKGAPKAIKQSTTAYEKAKQLQQEKSRLTKKEPLEKTPIPTEIDLSKPMAIEPTAATPSSDKITIKKKTANKLKPIKKPKEQMIPLDLLKGKDQTNKAATIEKTQEQLKVEAKKLEKTQPEADIESQIEQPTVGAKSIASSSTQAAQKKSEAVGALQGLSSTTKSGLDSSLKARNMPVYSSFSKPQFALFQKLVGLVTIESLRGVQKTEITLSMKDSIFNGLVVRLDQYDTDKHMFNINFFSSAQAQEVLIANIPNLQKAFDQGNFSFKVNILNPSLLKDKKIKKVEKSTEKNIQ